RQLEISNFFLNQMLNIAESTNRNWKNHNNNNNNNNNNLKSFKMAYSQSRQDSSGTLKTTISLGRTPAIVHSGPFY
ncbi:MAG: hypothetical protein N7Q72_05730, partial [Spiroplasma sp. Tabriz.8]|nr:hypothetical protein [Spiroplasma sp. Tabriz.8]